MRGLTGIIVIIAFIASSCDILKDDPELPYPEGRGAFILNEGNYLAGNGSLSYYSLETKKIYDNLFSSKNERPLGDIPTFMAVDGDRAFIIVNNSGTVEVIDLKTMESLGTLTGMISPRQMVIRGRKAYVSSLMSDLIYIVDIDNLVVTGTIDIACNSEALVISGNRLFAANWSGGDKITVVNLTDNTVETEIKTGLEPESMVLDRDNRLWVLCTGGYMNEEIPRIMKINTLTLSVEDELEFRTVSDNPSSLTVNRGGDTLYYLDEGVRRMTLSAVSLPEEIFIGTGGRLFYKLAAAPWNGMIMVTDAIDWQQRGDLLIYNRNGSLIDTEQCGIIPGYLHFKD
jgi:DNA-binding beta-propeller fold protein YncE